MTAGSSDSLWRGHPGIILVGIVGSVLLSLWSIHIDPIINNDGVHYILTAEYIAQGDLANAVKVFKWPAYSYLIYLAHLFPGVGYETAAHLITTAGFTLAVLAFVSVVHALGGRGRVLWLALVTALAYPGFNEFRSYLIRDGVFLALYLFALAAMFRFLASSRASEFVRTIMCFLVAALFRVEALAIGLMVMPFLAFGRVMVRRRHLPWIVYLALLLPLLVLFYAWWIYRPPGAEGSWEVLDNSTDFFASVVDQVLAEFRNRFGDAGADVGIHGVVEGAATAAWLVVRGSVDAMSLPYAGIVLWELARRRLTRGWPPGASRLLVVLIVVNAVVLFVFALAKFFLAPRYPLALAVTLVVAVPFALDRYVSTLAATRALARRIGGAALLGFLMVGNLAEGLDNFSDKYYLREAAFWLKDHADPGFRLASNDLKFIFYAGQYEERWVAFSDEREFREFLLSDQWKYKDYVGVNVHHREPGLEAFARQALKQEPIKQFEAANGDKLLIFYTGDE